MVFPTRCFCTSANKPPSESLIVVGCAIGRLEFGKGVTENRSTVFGKIGGKNYCLCIRPFLHFYKEVPETGFYLFI